MFIAQVIGTTFALVLFVLMIMCLIKLLKSKCKKDSNLTNIPQISKESAVESKVSEKEKEQQFFKENDKCCGPVVDQLYWPIDGKFDQNFERLAVPSGGKQLSVGGGNIRKGSY